MEAKKDLLRLGLVMYGSMQAFGAAWDAEIKKQEGWLQVEERKEKLGKHEEGGTTHKNHDKPKYNFSK